MNIQAILLCVGFGSVAGFVNLYHSKTHLRSSLLSQKCNVFTQLKFKQSDVIARKAEVKLKCEPRVSESPSAANSPSPESRRTLISFTGFGDLRIDDNEALLAALDSIDCSAAFIFDPIILSQMSERRLKLTYVAVSDLFNSLTKAGIPMSVRIGTFASEIVTIATERAATDIFFHDDPVHEVPDNLQVHNTLRASMI